MTLRALSHVVDSDPSDPQAKDTEPALPASDTDVQVSRKAVSPAERVARVRDGARLARAIQVAGSSQRQVAAYLDIPRPSLDRILKGEAPMRAELREGLPPKVRAAYHEFAAASAIDDAHHIPLTCEQGLMLAMEALGRVSEEYRDALADGQITHAESIRVLARVAKLERSVRAIRNSVENASERSR